VIVPDSTAPATCARKGTEIGKESTRSPAPTRNFATFRFMLILPLSHNMPHEATTWIPVSKGYTMLDSNQ
jgi:hypothetical protein